MACLSDVRVLLTPSQHLNYRHWNGWGDPEVPAPRVSWWVCEDHPTLPPPFLILRRSNSISKSPGPSSPKEPLLFSRDISRSESLRCSSSYSQQIFRPCDLIHGEVLGKGFFGQAIKVSTGGSCSAPLPLNMLLSYLLSRNLTTWYHPTPCRTPGLLPGCR